SKVVLLQHFLVSFAPGLLDCIETVLFELPPVVQGEGGCYCDLVSSFSQCGVVLFEFNGQVGAEDPVLSDRHVFTDSFPVYWVESLERNPVRAVWSNVEIVRLVWDRPIKNRRLFPPLLRLGDKLDHPLGLPVPG